MAIDYCALSRLFQMSKQDLVLEVVRTLEPTPQKEGWCITEREARDSINIEEIADEDGIIETIPEAVWVESVNREASLNCIAILNKLPDQLGLYNFRCLCVDSSFRTEIVLLKVWVVPTK